MAKYTYHTSHSYKDGDGNQVTFQTQLYQVGVYAIVNDDPAMQLNLTPGVIVSMEKKLKKQERNGKITDLVFGSEITVSDETGFWEEIKPL